MYLIVCSDQDLSALWACSELLKAGLHPVELVTQEILGVALTWEHWVDSNGAGFRIQLPDRRTIDSRSVKGVLNRCTRAPWPQTPGLSLKDAAYVAQELSALFLSLLEALPGPMLNPPAPQGLGGMFRHPSEWRHLASQAGLPTPVSELDSKFPGQPLAGWQSAGWQWGQQSTASCLVVGDRCLGNLPAGFAPGLVELSRAAHCPLLGVTMGHDPSRGPVLLDATPLPELMDWGRPLVFALMHELTTPCNGGP